MCCPFPCMRAGAACVTRHAWSPRAISGPGPDSPPHPRQGPLVVHQTYARLHSLWSLGDSPRLPPSHLSIARGLQAHTSVADLQGFWGFKLRSLARLAIALLGSVAPDWEEFLIYKRSSECLVCKQAIFNATWSWPNLTQHDSRASGQTNSRYPYQLLDVIK